jgi:hypothetical protein
VALFSDLFTEGIRRVDQKYFSELAEFNNGEVDFDFMVTFSQFDLIDIIDDCITYYELEPITIEQL